MGSSTSKPPTDVVSASRSHAMPGLKCTPQRLTVITFQKVMVSDKVGHGPQNTCQCSIFTMPLL